MLFFSLDTKNWEYTYQLVLRWGGWELKLKPCRKKSIEPFPGEVQSEFHF